MRRLSIALVAVALLAALSGYLLGRSSGAPTPARGNAASSEPPAPAVASTSAPEPKSVKQKGRKPKNPKPAPGAPAAFTPHAPLPPPDTPLARIRDTLEAQARAGDARAACRLGHELLRCQRTFERGAPDAEMLANAPPERVERDIEFFARMQNRIEEAKAICAGIELEDTRAAFDWLAQAAENGNVAAMTTYVRQPAIPMGRWIAEADRLVAYRDNAPRYAQVALEHGEPRVLGLMAAAHFDPGAEPMRAWGNWLGGLVPRDNVRAYAYAVLANRLYPPREGASFEFSEQRRLQPLLERLEATLTPNEKSQGTALADALAANQFRNATPRPTRPVEGPMDFRCEE